HAIRSYNLKELLVRFVLFSFLMFLPFLTYGQLDCIQTPEPTTNTRKENFWIGYVFQLNENYDPNSDYSRSFKTTGAKGANRIFKGYLKYDNEFFPSNSLNFDIDFGDNLGAENDNNYFSTNASFETQEAGCDVQLSNFGIIFRSRVRIPTNEPGIYRFTVGSDDGSRLNVQGLDPTTLHDNWGTHKTYVYNDNVINYYTEYTGGEVINLDLFYY